MIRRGMAPQCDSLEEDTLQNTQPLLAELYGASTSGLIGRRIVECEQKGEIRAEYGEELVERLAADLSARFGRGFAVRNVRHMKAF